MPPALIGLSHDYKNMSEWLDKSLKPDKKEFFWKTATQCYDTNWEDYAGMKVGDFFIKGQDALLEELPISVFNSACKSISLRIRLFLMVPAMMGTVGTPDVPLYIFEVCSISRSVLWYIPTNNW
jgi:hypothetical protein